MTLIASEVSRHGIVMVGDSAITSSAVGESEVTTGGAAKIQYSAAANIGFGLWGNAKICHSQIDEWLADFVTNKVQANAGLDAVGESLAEQLRYDLRFDGRSWHQVVGGIHLAGYLNGLPRLWHVHFGDNNENPHEPRLYRDFPEGKGWSEDQFRQLLSEGTAVFLRNGYIPYYGLVFERMRDYASGLRATTGVSFPQDSLRGHLEFHKVLIRFVAGVLVAAGKPQGVNMELSAIGFDDRAIQLDERLPVTQWLGGHGHPTMTSPQFSARPEARVHETFDAAAWASVARG